MPTDAVRPRAAPGAAFEAACSLLATVIDGSTRRDIIAEASTLPHAGVALTRLRDGMRAHVLKAATHAIKLERIVKRYDVRCREEGLHVLQDWDGKAGRINEDTIPVDVVNYLIDHRESGPPDRTVLAIALDYYLMYLLSLLAMRAWDEGDADANLDLLNGLLRGLQGPEGGGQPFAADAETLLLIATSHYEREEGGYDLLLERVRTLDAVHRLHVAIGHAAALGCHLRFGFEATYGRDTKVMRDDNVADYPWLSFSMATLMDEYLRLREAGVTGRHRDVIVEAMLNGFTADPRAMTGAPPPFCEPYMAEISAFCERFHAIKTDLLDELERFRPGAEAYSPLSLFFNFSQNVLKGTVVDALLWGGAWPLSLNDMLMAVGDDPARSALKTKLAQTLMGYARSNPDRIRGRLMPVIVYDPMAGRQACAQTLRMLRDA